MGAGDCCMVVGMQGVGEALRSLGGLWPLVLPGLSQTGLCMSIGTPLCIALSGFGHGIIKPGPYLQGFIPAAPCMSPGSHEKNLLLVLEKRTWKRRVPSVLYCVVGAIWDCSCVQRWSAQEFAPSCRPSPVKIILNYWLVFHGVLFRRAPSMLAG